MESQNTFQIEELKAQLDKARTELLIFYEITQAMRTTLHLDEVLYIILTGITAHQGLGFNRAVLFLVDYEEKLIRGRMGIGPATQEEANGVWRWIREAKKDLYDLIKEYHRIKDLSSKPRFFEKVQKIRLPFSEKAGVIYEALISNLPLHISAQKTFRDLRDDPLCKLLSLEEFVIVPLLAKNIVIGAILADNFITRKEITPSDVRILSMFASQAALAIENSQVFEDTLLKAHTDPLTSLWNYGYFQYRLDEEILRVSTSSKNLGVLMIDIDDFKKYNDAFGHPEGDKALVNIANLIRRSCRHQDIVARYGGEEFSVVLPELSKKETVLIAERIRSSIENSGHLFKKPLTVSIGLSSFPQEARKKEELIEKADIRLYKAKAEGKNKVVSF